MSYQEQYVNLLIDNYDLSFSQAIKIINEIQSDEVFCDNKITEKGNHIVIQTMKKLYEKGDLGIYCYYLN